MNKLEGLEPKTVFEYFEEICSIPHGSGNMEAISAYCMEFARKNGLRAVCDEAKNVVIYKEGTPGYENSDTIILQGHIDMVCQKTELSDIDFEKDGLDIFIDGDFVTANGTTLGADNGIAVAMIMSILASKELPHPPIEAVFTTDEEIGMIGAGKLDTSILKGKKMINLDAEEADFVNVSCAGGGDVTIDVPVKRKSVHGTSVTVALRNLKGGHSGIEIDKGRINANILMGRILNYAKSRTDFDLIGINGGTKSNAIPFSCFAEVVADDAETFAKIVNDYFAIVKKEIAERENNAVIDVTIGAADDYNAMEDCCGKKIVNMLMATPNGIMDMSIEIENLVETSLNLGILQTADDKITMKYALRSNKTSALDFLTARMYAFAEANGCTAASSGRYEPWEFKEESVLRELYVETFTEAAGYAPKVVAIHAGLECAVFSSSIEGLDCIAVGPNMFGVHTVDEKLSIASTERIYNILCKILKKSK